MVGLLRRRRCGVCMDKLTYTDKARLCVHCDLDACYDPTCVPCRMTLGAGQAALTRLRLTAAPWRLVDWVRPTLEGTQEWLDSEDDRWSEG